MDPHLPLEILCNGVSKQLIQSLLVGVVNGMLSLNVIYSH